MERFIHLRIKLFNCNDCGNNYFTIGGYGKCVCNMVLITQADRECLISLPMKTLFENIIDTNYGQLKQLYKSCKDTLQLIEKEVPELKEGHNGTND